MAIQDKGGGNSRGLAVAMGGGMPFGVVAIGLLKLLEERGAPIRALAGTSLGAIIGALYLRFGSADKVETVLDEFFGHLHPRYLLIRDFRFFQPGLLTGNTVMSHIEELLEGDFLLEDSPIPFLINATDLLRGKDVVLDSGSVLDAIRGSIAMPGIFVPHKWRDTYLVDGATTCPVPALFLHERGFRPVVPVRGLRTLPDEDEVDRERLQLEGEHLLQIGMAPSIIYVLWRAMGLIQQDDFARRLMEGNPLSVAPSIGLELGGDFHKVREMVQLGYDAAEEKWPLIEAALRDEAGG
jgi:NTE family protein